MDRPTDYRASRLRADVDLIIDSRLSALEASERLSRAISDHRLIDERYGEVRRLDGEIDGDRISLRVRGSRMRAPRKSWNIEFRGRVSAQPHGSTLEGQTAIPDRSDLRTILRLARAGTVLTGFFAVALTARDVAAKGIGSALWFAFAFLVVILGLAATALIEADGERAAGEDAQRLDDFLRRELEADQ